MIDFNNGYHPMPEDSAPWPAREIAALPVAIPYARPVNPPQKGPGTSDLLIGVGIIWAIELSLGMLAGLIIVVRAMIDGKSPFDVANDIGSMAWMLLPTVALSNSLAVIICWYFMCARYGRSLADGLALGKPPMRAVTLAFLIAALVVAFMYGIPRSAVETETDVPILQLMQGGGLSLFAFFAIIVAPMEEIYYRGFLYPLIRRSIGPTAAILIVSVWFTAIHAFQLVGALFALVPIFFMAITWTCMREATGSLWPSIVCHMTYNTGLMLINAME